MPNHINILLDAEWEVMMASFRRAPKPSKWKHHIRADTGELFTVRHVKGRFIKHYLGQEMELIPLAQAREVFRLLPPDQRIIASNGQQINMEEVAGTDAEWEARLVENITGNHQPRNHPVRVPTAPGQPVRR